MSQLIFLADTRPRPHTHALITHCSCLYTLNIPIFNHWLRVSERILFNIAVLTYRAVNGSDPVYLPSHFTRVADVPSRLRLRSSTSDQLIVPSYNPTTVGRRAFPVSAAKSLEQSPCTSHLSTVAYDFPATSLGFSLPALLS